MKKGGVRCCMCKRSNNPTHNVPKDYQGHVEAPVGHFWSQKCCTTCYKKAKNMVIFFEKSPLFQFPLFFERQFFQSFS